MIEGVTLLSMIHWFLELAWTCIYLDKVAPVAAAIAVKSELDAEVGMKVNASTPRSAFIDSTLV